MKDKKIINTFLRYKRLNIVYIMSVKQPISYYNPTQYTHRKRVVVNTTLKSQIDEINSFATRKIEKMISKITTGVTATAEATVSGGEVTEINIKVIRDNEGIIIFNGWGSNYMFAPLVTITGTGTNATAISKIDNDGHVISIEVTNKGSGYTIGNTIVTLTSPDTYPTQYQTELVFNEVYEEYSEKLIKPRNMTKKPLEYTKSSTIITNPLLVPVRNKITPIIDRNDAPFIDRSSTNDESFNIIKNRNALPIDESRYTHNLRVNRNSSLKYILQKANEVVDKKISQINENGGEKGAVSVSIGGGEVTGFNIIYGGQYYMKDVNSPEFIIERLSSDTGVAKAKANINLNGEVSSLTVLNGGSGYDPAHPPDVTIYYSDATETATAEAIINNIGAIIGFNITNPGSGYSRLYHAKITIKRVKGDPGIATGIVSSVDVNGSILSISVINAGSGYSSSTLPTVTITGGRGEVNRNQRLQMLKEIIDNIVTSSNNINKTNLSSGKGKSFSLVRNKQPPIVDVNDQLLRKRRLQFINKSSTIDSKARIAALKKFEKNYPNDVAIPPPPEPVMIKVTGYVSGKGYSTAPTIDFTSGGGVLAEADVTIDSNGAVTSVNVTFGGLYYVQSDITFVGDCITPASGYTIVENGVITDVVLNKGQDSLLLPTMNGDKIISVDVINGGDNYPNGYPKVTIQGNGAVPETAATATAKVNSNGQISGFIITDAGIDYNFVPTISISGGGGKGFNGTVVLTNKKVTSITINDPGTDYTSLEFIVPTGQTGSGASGYPIVENGSITQVYMTDFGSNYSVQEPPNTIYLQYVEEFEKTIISPQQKEETLPEPTLKASKGNMMIERQLSIEDIAVSPNQDMDIWPEKVNTRKINRNRARAKVIPLAISKRFESRDSWNVYLSDTTDDNLRKAKIDYDIAIKATTAAYELQKWKPTGNILSFGRELNYLYSLL